VEDVRARGDGRELLLTLPGGPVTLTVDRPRIEQVLVNLMDNALKFSPAATPIDVRLVTAEGGARIEVADQGPGVPEADRARLFERFYQAHVEGFRGGMGIGLYLAREIAERHGGRIEARFPSHGGSRFVIVLPPD
jgi:two-component system sensor histidine kinase KdpD